MKNWYLLLLILVVPFSSVFSDDDQINPDDFNARKLEKLILQEINKYRSSQKLSSLFDNQIISNVARDQLNYILIKNKVTHDQDIDEKKTVFDRVKFYTKKRPEFVSENISTIMVHSLLKNKDEKGELKDVIVTTYSEAARQIFLSWLNSPIHLKNLSIPEMQIAGTAVNLNPKSKKLIAVQVYAKI